MRLTPTGRATFGLLVLTLFAALASGNNLLYLLYSLMVSAFAVSAFLAKRAIAAVRVEIRFPDRAYNASVIRIRAALTNEGSRQVNLLRIRHGEDSVIFEHLSPKETRIGDFEATLQHRGKNALSELFLETRYPFGLLVARRTLEAIGTAVPRPREARDAAELNADSQASGRARPKKGAGDEVFGIRAYDESDDSRLINWKLSARTGRILVNEFSETGGQKVTVRVQGGSGPAAEARIIEAASAVAYYIGRGGDVRLETDESNIDYGKGLGHLDKMLEALALLGEGKSVRASKPGMSSQTPPPSKELITWTALGGLMIFSSLFLIDEIPRELLLLFAPIYPLGWWMDRKGLRIPEIIWQISSLVMLAYILLYDWHASGITLANTHLLMYMIVNRVLSQKGAKDLRQIFLIYFLAFFLVSGQTISMSYFIFFLLYTVFASVWLVLEQREGRRAPASTAQKNNSPVPIPSLAGALSVCLAATGIAFAATPRIEPLRRMNPFITMGLDKRRVKQDFVVQFTESVTLGWFGRLKKSSARVMRIKPLGSFRPGSLRVRGMAFDTFTGRRWTRSRLGFNYESGRNRLNHAQDGRAWAKRQPNGLVFPGQPTGPAPAMEISLFPFNSAVLFTTHGLRSVDTKNRAAYFDHADSAFFGSKYLSGITYRIHGSPKPQLGFGHLLLDYDFLLNRLFLELPRGHDPRITELAKRITANAQTPGEKTQAVVAYLNRGFEYSLYSDDADRTLSNFLFESKSGNCEFFATSAAMLLRSVGVPARLVTGFLANDWNEYGEFFDVRQGQAHAWVEAWVGGEVGWMTVEATPPVGELSQHADALWARAQRYFTAVQFRWYRHVIGYDSFVQRDTFHRVRHSLQADALERVVDHSARLGGRLAALLAFFFLGRALWRRRNRQPENRFQLAERVLRRSGFTRSLEQTPREFAKSIAVPSVEALVELHYLERYSGRPLSQDETERADRLFTEIQSALKNYRKDKTTS